MDGVGSEIDVVGLLVNATLLVLANDSFAYYLMICRFSNGIRSTNFVDNESLYELTNGSPDALFKAM